MPNFIELIEELQEILESLDTNTTFNEDNLSEKIMTKKQKKQKQKLRAKRRAERKAEKRAELQAQQQTTNTEDTDVIEGEIIDLSDDDLKEINDAVEKADDKQLPAPVENPIILIKEQNSNEEYTPSELWKKIYPQIQEACRKHKELLTNAQKALEALGQNKPITKEVWEMFNNAMVELKTAAEKIASETDVNLLTDEEVVMYDRFMEALDGYSKNVGEIIMSIKPDLSEDDFKAPDTTSTTDVATTDDKDDKEELLALPDKSSKPTTTTKNTVDKKQTKNLIKVKDFLKKFNSYSGAFDEICDAFANVFNFAKSVLAHPADFIADKTFAFLTSPVAKDFVKTFMYANPITAMIFDGKLGAFGFGNLLDKAKNKTKQILQKAQEGGKGNIKSDDRDLPTNISELQLRDIKNLFHSYKFSMLVNVSYNHPDVNEKYKVNIKKYVTEVSSAITAKDVKSARKSLTLLVETLKYVCDSMNWKKPKDWIVFGYIIGHTKGYGLTDAEDKKITQKAQSKSGDESESTRKLRNIIDTIIKIEVDERGHSMPETSKMIKTIQKHYKNDKFDADDISELYEKYKKQYEKETEKIEKQKEPETINASYNLHKINTKLQQLLERAEA